MMAVGVRQAARAPTVSPEQVAAWTEDLAELWHLGDLKRLGPLRLGHRCYPSAHLAAQELLGRAADLQAVPPGERQGAAYGIQRRELEQALTGLRRLLLDIWGEVGIARREA